MSWYDIAEGILGILADAAGIAILPLMIYAITHG